MLEEYKKIFIECECGTHLLQVASDVEFFDDTSTNHQRVRQEFEFAMFTYGTYRSKPNLWRRLRIIWNYFITGKMYSDQILMTPEEAKKLANFINENIRPTET